MIVLLEPMIDDDLRVPGCREPFRVENFSAQRAIKPLVVSVLRKLRRAGFRNLQALAASELEALESWMFAEPGDVAIVQDSSLLFGIVGSGGVIHCLSERGGLDHCALAHAVRVGRP